MTGNSTSLLPGQSPPIATITPTDQTGVLLITTSMGLAIAVLSLLIRGYVRLEFSRSYGWDDVLVVIAFVFLIGQSGALLAAVQHGLGRTIDNVAPSQLATLQQAYYASDLLYIPTLWLSKISMAFLFLRISPNKRHELMSRVLIGLTALTGTVAFLIVALRCDLARPWVYMNAQCHGLFARWQTVLAFDAATEIALFVVPFVILAGVQMSMQNKATIIFAFALRLPVIIPAVFRLHYLSSAIDSPDPTLDADFVVVNTQVELVWAVVAATIPCLRPFMAATQTTWGGRGETTVGSGYAKSSQQNKYSRRASTKKKSPLASFGSMTSKLRSQTHQKGENRSQDIDMNTKSETGWIREPQAGQDRDPNDAPADHRSVESHDSKRLMIRRDVEWKVEYENRHEMPGSGVEV